MRDEREHGLTFTIDRVCFIDWESSNRKDGIDRGTYNYAAGARGVLLAYAIGDGPVQIIELTDFDGFMHWADMPAELRAFHERVEAGEAVYCAHKASFDRAIWNFGTADFPLMAPHHIIDSMVQITAAGFAGPLDIAAKQAGLGGKAEQGKDMIYLFCVPGTTATPASHPAEWQSFKDYAVVDVELMRELFLLTMQLPLAEWREYWAAEVVNERGLLIDVPMVEHAAKLIRIALGRASAELIALTDGAVNTIDEVKRMINWMLDIGDPTLREMLVKRLEERDEETGEVTRSAKHSLKRERLELMLDYLNAKPEPTANDAKIIRLLEIRSWKAQNKFEAMALTHFEGVLKDQYRFGGAPGSGRFSSIGAQIHNLKREPLDYELEAIDALRSGCSFEEFDQIGS